MNWMFTCVRLKGGVHVEILGEVLDLGQGTTVVATWVFGNGKTPHLFSASDGAPILAFAGLLDRWKDSETGQERNYPPPCAGVGCLNPGWHGTP